MRPSYIHVFDGLRITTEHLRHWQDSIQSSIFDLRVSAGLNRVHQGFVVRMSGQGQLTVDPGTAFDSTGARVVQDEPKELKLDASNIDGSWFVTARYKQVPGGEVEGQPTMLWDSADLAVEPQAPPDSDRRVLLARVDRKQGEVSITDLRVRATQTKPEVPANTASIGVLQGVERFNPSNETDVSEFVTTAAPVDSERQKILSEINVALDFPILTVSCRLLGRLTMTLAGPLDSGQSWTSMLTLNSAGEATPTNKGFDQSGLMTTYAPAWGAPHCEMSDTALASISLREVPEQPAWAAGAIDRLTLEWRVETRPAGGFRLVALLTDSTENTGGAQSVLTGGTFRLVWQGSLSWKAWINQRPNKSGGANNVIDNTNR